MTVQQQTKLMETDKRERINGRGGKTEGAWKRQRSLTPRILYLSIPGSNYLGRYARYRTQSIKSLLLLTWKLGNVLLLASSPKHSSVLRNPPPTFFAAIPKRLMPKSQNG